MELKKHYKSYLFILPSFILICIFFYYPVFYAISSSFTDLRLGEKASFIGVNNFVKLFADPVFLKGLANQMIFTAADIAKSLFFPLLAAELLYFIRARKLQYWLKTLLVTPMLVPSMVIILMWVYIYDINFGAINSLLDLAGLESLKHNWLKEEGTAIWSVIAIGFPFVSGLYFLIFQGGLEAISKEIEESAVIDGCMSLQLVRYIHLPGIRQYISVVVILSLISSLQDYAKILVTTKGGPGFKTYIPALHMYLTAFGSYDMGYASSMGVVLFIIIICLTLISMKFSKSSSN